MANRDKEWEKRYTWEHLNNTLSKQIEKINNEQELVKIAMHVLERLDLEDIDVCTLRFARSLEQNLYKIQMKCVALRNQIAL